MKKQIFAAFVLAFLFLLSGCWDSKEINELGFVIAIGIDRANDSGDYILTIQIANPKLASRESSSSGGNANPFYVYSARGRTLIEAARELTRISSKRLTWAHTYIIIIGESMAKSGILPAIDVFTHTPDLRMQTPIVVSKGDAMQYMAIESGMEDIPGIAYSLIYDYDYLSAQYIDTDILGMITNFYSEYAQTAISSIGFTPGKLIPSEVPTSELKDHVQFGGSAVFDKDKMIGWLTPEQTKGMAWVLNETHDTMVTVKEPSQPDRYVSVQTNNVTTKVTAYVDNANPSVLIDITGEGSIVEEDGTTGLPMDEFKKAIGGLVEQNIVDTLSETLYMLQKVYRSDALGLAKTIHAQHNDEWENSIKAQWKEIYPDMPITLNVKITIGDSDLNQLPMRDIQKD